MIKNNSSFKYIGKTKNDIFISVSIGLLVKTIFGKRLINEIYLHFLYVYKDHFYQFIKITNF